MEETTDRIAILEDTQELQCKARDVEYLHTKDSVASLRDLVRFTLRLSPDRIVIGEVGTRRVVKDIAQVRGVMNDDRDDDVEQKMQFKEELQPKKTGNDS